MKCFSSFSAGLSNTQIVIVDVQGMVCDFCARGIEKTFNDDKDVKKKVDVSLDKGKGYDCLFYEQRSRFR